MPDFLENQPEPPPYRFIDDSEAQTLSETTPRMLGVEFYPSIDDFVHISESNAKKYPVKSVTKWGLMGFFLINSIASPALLLYAGFVPAALLAFGLNVLFVVMTLPSLVRSDYRRFYRTHFGNLENEVVRIELHPTGVACTHLSDSSFYSWKNFISSEETKDSLLFYMTGGRGLAVRKTGFAYECDKDEFIAFARQRMNQQKLNDGSGNS